MKIKATTKDAYNLMHEGSLALAEASRNGMRVDVPYCEKTLRILEKKINRSEKQLMNTSAGRLWSHIYGNKMKVGSDLQLRNVLFHKLKCESVKETTSGLPAVDNESLSIIDNPCIEPLLKHRRNSKTRDYLLAFMREQVNGFIHPNFNLNFARTFRSSSNSPNFQNQPKRDVEQKETVRQAIYAREGCQIVAADFSGAEVRVATCYHKDPTMLKYINDPTTDMHGDMAEELYLINKIDKHIPAHKTLRNGAKNGFVFPQFYGDYYGNNVPNLLQWAKNVELEDGTPVYVHLKNNKLLTLNKDGSIRSDKKYIQHVRGVENDFWKSRFPVYKKWKEKHYKRYQRKGYVDMFTGFRCSGFMTKNEVINYVVQGAAFHCLLWAFVQTNNYIKEKDLNSRLIGQIHDEIVTDVDPGERKKLVKRINRITTKLLPREWKWIIVPIEIEAEATPVDGSWAKMEEIELNG